METKIVKITPSIAEQYLGKNESNRNLLKSRVTIYSKDIKAGRWKFNPNPIVFDEKGTLIDGQHRLHAIIEAGEPVDMLVMFGAPSESKDIIDFGKPRTSSDILKMEGYVDTNNVAALGKRILGYDAGLKSILAGTSSAGSESSGAAMNLSGATKKEVVDYCRENYPMLLDLVSVARQIYEKSPIRLMAPSEIAFFLYAFEPYEDAVRFMEMVISGIGLNEETPELAMRRILERARFKKDMAITSADLTEYFFVAFDKHQKGETCHILRISKRRS